MAKGGEIGLMLGVGWAAMDYEFLYFSFGAYDVRYGTWKWHHLHDRMETDTAKL